MPQQTMKEGHLRFVDGFTLLNRFPTDFLVFSLDFLRFCNGFPEVFQRISHGFSMDFPWLFSKFPQVSTGFPQVFQWISLGFPMDFFILMDFLRFAIDFLRFSDGSFRFCNGPQVFQQITLGFPKDFLRFSNGFPQVFQWIS